MRAVGDPVDTAIALAAHERGLTGVELLEGQRPLCELPFDPVRKRMTLVYDEGDGRYLYVKGGAGGRARPLDDAAGRSCLDRGDSREVGFQGAEGAGGRPA